MTSPSPKCAVVIGAGPNGLAAALRLARAGVDVTVLEAAPTVGGGCRTAELTLPGFRHDVCATVLPFAVHSPAFRDVEVDWLHPPVACAHPLDDGDAVLLHRSLDETARGLGVAGDQYRRVVGPFVRAWPRRWSARDVLAARPSLARGLFSAERLARRFATERARAFLAGHAAHSSLPLHRAPSGGFALVLCAAAHVSGWPFVRGGSQALVDALAASARDLGVTIQCDTRVDELPRADVVLADVAPCELARIAGVEYAPSFRHAPGAFKVDYALDAPVPWANPAVARAGTIHVGGTFDEVARSERELLGPPPFLLAAQPSLFDDTRAPRGKHTLWVYCHVPNGWDGDLTAEVDAQIERFAPGFGSTVLARRVTTPRAYEDYNPSFVGGDVIGGATTLRQFVARPTWRQWKTPVDDVWLCSASTPPGGGVHGLNGLIAASLALRGVS